MKVTIRDVAEYVGVSVASVSLVLNEKECRIPEETQKKIISGAEELGYKVKPRKKQITRKVIGIVYSSMDNELIKECLKAIDDYASLYGYETFQMYCADDSRKCVKKIKNAVSFGAAGLIVIPPNDMNSENHHVLLGDALSSAKVPFVLLDRAIFKVFCDFVTADIKMGANIAVEYLIRHGHKKVGILAGRKEVYNTRKRVEGYKEGLALNKIHFEDSLVYYSCSSADDGKKGIEHLINQGATAVLAGSVELAQGVYEYSKQNGKKIGEDISIIGFVSMVEGKRFHPILTSIYQPGEQMGRKAAEIIINRIQKKDVSNVKTNYFVPALMEGESVNKLNCFE